MEKLIRFTLFLNESTPLRIYVSADPQNVQRLLYYNNSMIKNDSKEIFLPCATSGIYDLVLVLKTKRRLNIKVEAVNEHPFEQWSLRNRSVEVKLRTQNRIQKKQMILKWSKSKLDVHDVHYCLVINTNDPKRNFCKAVGESMQNRYFKVRGECNFLTTDGIWFRQRKKIKEIHPNATNIVCTGKKSQQIINGLISHKKYFIDIFGIHMGYKNLPFLLKSTTVWFNRTHPITLKNNALSIEKISGITSISVFSFKIPANLNISQLRYFILPCGGSQIDAKILRNRTKLLLETGIHKPMFITLKGTQPGGRYILRITPSNEDEILKANKVGVAVSTDHFNNYLPRLPNNTTVFEIRSARTCDNKTKIAWYASPEQGEIEYCVIVLKLPKNNRSSFEANYCMDFSRKTITRHPLFHYIKCDPGQYKTIETLQLLNFIPDYSYLIYVTVKLVRNDVLIDKAIPYQSLRINFNLSKHCHKEFDGYSSSSAVVSD